MPSFILTATLIIEQNIENESKVFLSFDNESKKLHSFKIGQGIFGSKSIFCSLNVLFQPFYSHFQEGLSHPMRAFRSA
jgi:hypothetical protein